MSLKPRQVDFDSTWSTLLETVKGVITCGRIPRATWNDRFSDVYALCVACPEPLGDKLYQETRNFLEDHVKTLHKTVMESGEENLLAIYHRHWEEYSKGSGYLNQLYGYLNSTFIKKQKYTDADLNYGGFNVELSDQMLEIGELALETWKKYMIEPLKDHLLSIILQEIRNDRLGGTVNQTVLHGVINSFVDVEEYKKKFPLQLYEEMFETKFLQETGDYYRQEAAKLKDECSCSEYMEKVIMKLDNENFRSRKFLNPSSYNKVTYECQQRMVADHLQFLHGECREMVQSEKRKDTVFPLMNGPPDPWPPTHYSQNLLAPTSLCSKVPLKMATPLTRPVDNILVQKCKIYPSQVATFYFNMCPEPIFNYDLSNMFKLLKPIHGGLGVLVEEVEGHIRAVGLEAVKNLKGDNVPAQFVENMLEVHGKYTEMIKSVFQNDQQFVGALDKACAAAINYRPNPKQQCRSPELLARYCDNLLKKSSKGSSEAEMDDKLSSCITVFKYLDDKDVFQRHYSRNLAKRLIHGQSASMDAEEVMINKLKQACGYEFTNKLHRMFQDVTVSSGLSESFNIHMKEVGTELGLNFTIMVLQAGAWPIGQSNLPTFAIPQELERSVSLFEAFYNKKYNGRKLTWMHNFCNAELRLNYLKRPYAVTMGSFQMAVLLMFNNEEKYAVNVIVRHTKLPAKELKKQAQSLVDAKLLLCETEGELQDNSELALNMNYTNKRLKFKINAVIQKDTQQEMEHTRSAVDEDRKMYLQAAIVRTMKARKILKHNLLIQEVISQAKSRFFPNVSMIKKCIEALIDKQYLERTQNSDEYSYVA